MTRTQATCVHAAFMMLWLACASGGSVHAQTGADNTVINLGGRGGIALGAPAPTSPAPERPDNPIEFSFRAGLATDYIYRGTTLSAHQPAVGAAVEATLGLLYGGGTIASVNLPSKPAPGNLMSGGVRPKVGEVQFDFGATYFAYPGETPPIGVTAGINYWEALARADTKLGELLRVAAGFAYSPNVSNTGAWSKYAAFGLGFDLPSRLLPADVSVSLTGVLGYSWFGNQSVQFGGFPLPAYANWNAGATFSRR